MSNQIGGESNEERNINMKHEEQIMLHLADFLLKNNLITPEEKLHLRQLIQKGGSSV